MNDDDVSLIVFEVIWIVSALGTHYVQCLQALSR